MGMAGASDTFALEQFPLFPGCRIIDFTDAKVLSFSENIKFLIVNGTKPFVNMRVMLNPRVYVVTPDYWEYDVVGCVGGRIIPRETPYVLSEEIAHYGTKGIEVFGATKRKRIKISPPSGPDVVTP